MLSNESSFLSILFEYIFIEKTEIGNGVRFYLDNDL